MNNKATGGGTFGGQPAVINDATTGTFAAGLSNVGMLIRTWGAPTCYTQWGTPPCPLGQIVWINDGSNLHDGNVCGLTDLTTGVAVLLPPARRPTRVRRLLDSDRHNTRGSESQRLAHAPAGATLRG